MRYYEAASTIDASPAEVWAVLSDGTTWTAWESGVDGFEGRIAPGETVKIRAEAAPGRAFPVKVTTFNAPRQRRSMPDLAPSFEKFARGLKQRVESGG